MLFIHVVLINKQTYKKFWEELITYFPWYDTDLIENDVSNNSSVVACVFVTAVKAHRVVRRRGSHIL
jgi:hypothetical protein